MDVPLDVMKLTPNLLVPFELEVGEPFELETRFTFIRDCLGHNRVLLPCGYVYDRRRERT